MLPEVEPLGRCTGLRGPGVGGGVGEGDGVCGTQDGHAWEEGSSFCLDGGVSTIFGLGADSVDGFMWPTKDKTLKIF